jgi:hypothetical protein
LIFRFPGRFLITIGLGMAAAALQASALALVQAVFVRSGYKEGGALQPYIELANRVVPGVGDLLHGVIPWLVILVCILGISAVFQYGAGVNILVLWRRYQMTSLNEILLRIQAFPSRVGEGLTKDEKRCLVAVMGRSSRLGSGARLILSSFSIFLRFLWAFSFALYTNAGLTLYLIVLVMPSVGFSLFYFGRRAAGAANRAISHSGLARKDLENRVTTLLEGGKLDLFAMDGKDKTPFVVQVNATLGRLLRIEESKVVSTLFACVVLGVMLVSLSLDVANGQMTWAEGGLYIFVFFLAIMQLNHFSSTLSSFGSFYPTFLLYKVTLEVLADAKTSDEVSTRIQGTGLLKSTGLGGRSAVIDEEE